MYRAQSLSLHSPLIISGGPLNPQCLAHKRCSLCEQEGRAHALSFSVLCGVTASLAFLVFSFLCVVFFFFLETSWVLFAKLIALQVCPVVQPTALHLSISCLTHLLSARLDPSRCLIPKAQLSVAFFTVVHYQPSEENTYIIMGTFSTWRFLMGMDIHPGIDKIVRTWYWGSTPKEEAVLGSHCPQYSERSAGTDFLPTAGCLYTSLALVASGPTWYCTDLCKCRAWKALHEPFES